MNSSLLIKPSLFLSRLLLTSPTHASMIFSSCFIPEKSKILVTLSYDILTFNKEILHVVHTTTTNTWAEQHVCCVSSYFRAASFSSDQIKWKCNEQRQTSQRRLSYSRPFMSSWNVGNPARGHVYPLNLQWTEKLLWIFLSFCIDTQWCALSSPLRQSVTCALIWAYFPQPSHPVRYKSRNFP